MPSSKQSFVVKMAFVGNQQFFLTMAGRLVKRNARSLASPASYASRYGKMANAMRLMHSKKTEAASAAGIAAAFRQGISNRRYSAGPMESATG